MREPVYTRLCMRVRVSSACLEAATMLYMTLGWTSFNNKKNVFALILLNLTLMSSLTLKFFYGVLH